MNTDLALKKIGARLRQVRREKGFSNYEYFAYEFEFDKRTIRNAEQGKNVEMKTFFRILEILNVSPSEFFEGIE